MLLKSLITTNWIVKNLVALSEPSFYATCGSELSFYATCGAIQLGLPYIMAPPMIALTCLLECACF